MYKEGKLMVPTDLVGRVMRQLHSHFGHPGGPKLWAQLERAYLFPDPAEAKKMAKRVKTECEICQITEASMGPYKAHVRPSPIPPALMSSVCVDLFAMPQVTVGGQKFDTIALCVDRLSGWIVAIPCLDRGLTSQKVATAMFEKWDIFGIPDVVTSDRGAHFVGGWWRTLCAKYGVRTAYAQAYHHSANGRAESAGQFVIKKLRQIIAEEGGAWVDWLPRAVLLLNNTPGESGLSPYQICFGRERPMAQFPVNFKPESEDAVRFFEKMRKIDQKAAERLNALQQKRADSINRGR